MLKLIIFLLERFTRIMMCYVMSSSMKHANCYYVALHDMIRGSSMMGLKMYIFFCKRWGEGHFRSLGAKTPKHSKGKQNNLHSKS